MKLISAKNAAWIDAYDGPLFDYVVNHLQEISEQFALYPFIMAFRRGSITRTFAFTSRGSDFESTESFARAACDAYDPDEAVFTYAANMLKNEKELQGLVITCAKDAKPRLTFLRLESNGHGWIPVAVIGDAPEPDKLGFMFKDAAIHFYTDQSERRGEARAFLSDWMPDIDWDFDLGIDDNVG